MSTTEDENSEEEDTVSLHNYPGKHFHQYLLDVVGLRMLTSNLASLFIHVYLLQMLLQILIYLLQMLKNQKMKKLLVMISKGWKYLQVNICSCVFGCICSHMCTTEDEKSENKEVASPQQGIEKSQGKQLCSPVCLCTLCVCSRV